VLIELNPSYVGLIHERLTKAAAHDVEQSQKAYKRAVRDLRALL